MYFINPFKGLRPTKENASSVAVSSTDHLSKDSLVDHKRFGSVLFVEMINDARAGGDDLVPTDAITTLPAWHRLCRPALEAVDADA